MAWEVLNLVRWEWFKVRRRWMPWILLVILLLFSQLAVWGSYFSYKSDQGMLARSTIGYSANGQTYTFTCEDVLSGNIPSDIGNQLPSGSLEQFRTGCEQQQAQQQTRLANDYQGFSMPGGLITAMSVSQGIGLALIAILMASVLGTEYGWGTVRSILSRGTGRWQYLASKGLLVAGMALAALIVAGLVTSVSSVIAQALAGSPPAGYASTASWGEALTTFLKGLYALLPYIVLPAMITVLTRSSAIGVALALGYYFAEQIVVAILTNVFSWFHTVSFYLLNQNIAAWMESNAGNGSFGGGFIGGNPPSHLHAFIVVLAYILVLGGIAFWAFMRRDVGGATGV